MPESARESLEAELFRSTFWFQVSILIFLTFMQLTFVFVVPTWPLLLGLIYLGPLSIILVARLLISLDDDERRGQRRFAVTCSTVTVLGAITLVWVVQNHPELMLPQTEPGRAAGVHGRSSGGRAGDSCELKTARVRGPTFLIQVDKNYIYT